MEKMRTIATEALSLTDRLRSVAVARQVFVDSRRVIAKDESHSKAEARFRCFGKACSGILTVRFTYRASVI